MHMQRVNGGIVKGQNKLERRKNKHRYVVNNKEKTFLFSWLLILHRELLS